MTHCCSSLFATRQLDFQQKELQVMSAHAFLHFFASIQVPSGNHDGAEMREFQFTQQDLFLFGHFKTSLSMFVVLNLITS